jgi:tetratricopeptide (TPR) repeat protein
MKGGRWKPSREIRIAVGVAALTFVAIIASCLYNGYCRAKNEAIIQQAVAKWNEAKALLPPERTPTNMKSWDSSRPVDSNMRSFAEGVSQLLTAKSTKVFKQQLKIKHLSPQERALCCQKALPVFEQADSLFQKATGTERQRFDLQFQLGETFFDEGDPETARVWFQKAADLKRMSGDDHDLEYAKSENFLGRCCLLTKRYEEAIVHLKKDLAIVAKISKGDYNFRETVRSLLTAADACGQEDLVLEWSPKLIAEQEQADALCASYVRYAKALRSVGRIAEAQQAEAKAQFYREQLQ